MKSMILTILVASLCGCNLLQTKRGKEIKQVETMISESFKKAPRHEYQPYYWLVFYKMGCRMLLKLDDIPINFILKDKDEGFWMPIDINYRLMYGGEHTLSVEVFPQEGQTAISKDAGITAAIIFFNDKKDAYDVGYYYDSSKGFIGKVKDGIVGQLEMKGKEIRESASYYCDTLKFTADLPFDHRHILSTAKDLHSVPDLESKVVAYYRNIYDMLVARQFAQYMKDIISPILPLHIECCYSTPKEYKELMFLDTHKELFHYDCNITDWEIYPFEDFENYEVVICGNGKLAYLQRKDRMEEVLKVKYKKDNETYYQVLSPLLYIPHNNNEVKEVF